MILEIFKAFFMAGGPGSGKSFVASNAFGEFRFKICQFRYYV